MDGQLVVEAMLVTDANTDDVLEFVAMKSAIISPCGTYRYELRRGIVDGVDVHLPSGPGSDRGYEKSLVICGLNPSTADAVKNDQTILKEIAFGRAWGCDVLIKVNFEAFRARDPMALKRARASGVDVTGPDNDDAIYHASSVAAKRGIFLGAWGTHVNDDAQAMARIAVVLKQIADGGSEIMCLGTNKDGSPKHPLYLKLTTPLVPWAPR